jgi:hypothetical protein
MSDQSTTDPSDDPVLGPPPSVPLDLWGELLDGAFASGPGESDDSLLPEDPPVGDEADQVGTDGWDDEGVATDAVGSDGDAASDGHLDVLESGHHEDLDGPPDVSGLS